MDNATALAQPKLSQIIREAMELQHISRNMLAQAAGVSEGTIRNLLKDDEPGATGPQGLVLKAVCTVLHLDDIRVFQAAGFLSPDRLTSQLSIRAEILGMRFDRLPTDKQELLVSMLESLEKVSGLPSVGPEVDTVVEEVRKLRRKHPVFKERRVVLTDRLGRFLGNALGKLTNETVEDITLTALVDQLRTLYRNDPTQLEISPESLRSVVNHPHSVIVLNTLLPRKNVPSNVEKLYWLTYPAVETPNAEHHQAVKDLWDLLVQVSRSPIHETAE
ncbi:MAG: helix-turn-helix domain-containing protein [Aggregatilineales bacterium]